MGVLDDAIREHLDLKRRRGADPGEVRQEEDEALGPVPQSPRRRDGESAQSEQEPQEVAEVTDAPPEQVVDEEIADEAPAVEHQATQAFDASELAEALGREPEPALEETEEPDAAEHEAIAAPEGDEHDQLEETPEFMRESPDHDKLWFEQKPPKDFDF